MNSPTSAAGYTVERLGDAGLLLRFGDRIDAAINTAVHQAATRLRARQPGWVQDLVPAYATLGVVIDDSADGSADAAQPARGSAHVDLLQHAEDWVHAVLRPPPDASMASKPRLVELPVDYGGRHGPDLDAVAQHVQLSIDAVIRRHTQAEYTVAMLGFAPGFPYLLGLDPSLAMPRLAAPRERVEAGSVAIGGEQTGVYPQAGPGGWRVIGHTDAVLFDPQNTPPTALQPGDRVRFVERSRT